ncbi:ankyrin repeat domain-containing protein [Arenicella xantha]|uniref:Ankyrin repeat protein n=1 Tax=Arenicella xantha TaxID=644221 RepID=A0A395JM10_9GAMM|nr:ankyrin repeat domain-containing protein [Arenicella xantha]RBP48820.1 ankyrin repeat protein [Arenicella xantha]
MSESPNNATPSDSDRSARLMGVNPLLLILLLAVLAFAVYLQVSNPHKKYSRQAYWQTATVDDVYTIPDEALQPGNRNGPVLLWAATGANDPEVIAALVERGADVNESDAGAFSGTPLSAAAGYSSNPAIIDVLVRLGADIHKVVGSNNKTPLIIAAEINQNPEIAERLIRHGANLNYRDLTGRTAIEQAIRFENNAVAAVLRKHSAPVLP